MTNANRPKADPNPMTAEQLALLVRAMREAQCKLRFRGCKAIEIDSVRSLERQVDHALREILEPRPMPLFLKS
jgi:hypothetical protein